MDEPDRIESARGTRAVRLPTHRRLAVERHRQYARRRRLARPTRATEKVGVRHLALLHGVAQCPCDMLLAQDVGETLGPVPPV